MAEAQRYQGMSGTERRLARRRRLIDAALDVLVRDGADRLTVTGVCAEAGLSQRYFYESFTDRAQLLNAVFDGIGEAGAQSLIKAASQAPADPWQRARAIVDGLVDMLLADPRLSRLAVLTRTDETLMRSRAATAEQVAQAITAHTDLFWPAVSPHSTPTQVALLLVVGGITDVIVSWHTGQLDCSRSEMVDLTATLFVALGDSIARMPPATPSTEPLDDGAG